MIPLRVLVPRSWLDGGRGGGEDYYSFRYLYTEIVNDVILPDRTSSFRVEYKIFFRHDRTELYRMDPICRQLSQKPGIGMPLCIPRSAMRHIMQFVQPAANAAVRVAIQGLSFAQSRCIASEAETTREILIGSPHVDNVCVDQGRRASTSVID